MTKIFLFLLPLMLCANKPELLLLKTYKDQNIAVLGYTKEKGLILLMSPYASDDEIAYIVSTLNKKDI